MIVVVIFALINGVAPSWSWFLVIPIILELYLLSLGIAFLLGAINVKYRDITSIWDVLVQALFYAVPIIYPIQMVAGTSTLAAKIILLNPIAQCIQDVRFNLITPETVTTWNFVGLPYAIVPLVIVVVILIAGALTFRHKSKFFAEEV